jgi:hypothetical protein
LAWLLILPQGKRIPKITKGLTNPNRPGRRFQSAGKASTDAEAAPELPEENRKDDDVATKLDAIEAMEDSADPKSIAALGEALTDQNRKMKAVDRNPFKKALSKIAQLALADAMHP